MNVDLGENIEQISEWVSSVALSQGLADNENCLQLISTWQSRTATLHRFALGPPPGRDVVLKLLDRKEDACGHFEGMRDLASALDDLPFIDHLLSTPLGFSSDLGAVLMPYVSGTQLFDLLEREDWSSANHDEILNLVNSCGVLLSRYHSKLSPLDESGLQMAWDDLDSRLTKVLGPKPEVREFADNRMVAQSYGDFHPEHVIVTDDKKMVLVDPPIDVEYKFVYRDLAVFAYNLYMFFIQPRMMRRNRFKLRHYQILTEAFLEGYANELGRNLSDDDHFFINGCLAFLLRRRLITSWHEHSYGLLAYHLMPLSFRLIELRHSLRQHLKRRS